MGAVMHREDAEQFIFMDFEASGLGPQSWPIEIGLSWIEGGAVKTWSSLIRPEPDWDMEAWDPVSARVHGIPLDQLAKAPAAGLVAAEAAKRISGKTVCSDAPKHDERWARRLFLEGAQPVSLRIFDIYSAFEHVLSEAGMDHAHEKLARLPAPHRAGPDAGRYARALLHGLKY